MRKTKIVCTIGPASEDDTTIEKLIKAGMNCARLNLSHGTVESHMALVKKLKAIRERLSVPLSIMLDNKGPEIRIAQFENGSVELKKGQKFTLTLKRVIDNNEHVMVNSPRLMKLVQVGTEVLLDDGNIELKVVEIKGKDAICRVVVGGILKNNKSINLPGVDMKINYLRDSNPEDLELCVRADVEYFALSFVSSKKDVECVRAYLAERGCFPRLISKIENAQGVKNIDEILKASDGVMVARGDLGVEVDYTLIPAIQKEIIKKSNDMGKICITATQMLESMTHSQRPTRAEITDVSNAVYEGSSAVMLSGETASGEYPVESVSVMSDIALEAEKNIDYAERYNNGGRVIDDFAENLAHAAVGMALNNNAKAIIVATNTGESAMNLASFVTKPIIFATTPNSKTYYTLGMCYGVEQVLIPEQKNIQKLFEVSKQQAITRGIIKRGDSVVILAGEPGSSVGTNQIKVEIV